MWKSATDITFPVSSSPCSAVTASPCLNISSHNATIEKFTFDHQGWITEAGERVRQQGNRSKHRKTKTRLWFFFVFFLQGVMLLQSLLSIIKIITESFMWILNYLKKFKSNFNTFFSIPYISGENIHCIKKLQLLIMLKNSKIHQTHRILNCNVYFFFFIFKHQEICSNLKKKKKKKNNSLPRTN